MNLELVPCMFKSRAEDGKESEVVGFVIRTPGSTTGTIVPTTSAPPTTSKPGITASKQQKIQPRRSDPVIAPKRLETLPQKILPATATSKLQHPAPSLSNGSTSNISATNKPLGIGNFIEFPVSTVTPASVAPSIKPPPKPRSRSTKSKTKAKVIEDISPTPLQAPPSLPSTSFEMQSPPQLLLEKSYSQTASVPTMVSASPPSYLPPISAIAASVGPSTSYHQAIPQLSSNGCTSDDLNAIEIAHSLSNDQKARNEYMYNHSHSASHSSHDQYYNNYDSTYMYHPHHQPNQQTSHSSSAYPSIYPQTSEYGGPPDQINGYCQTTNNGVVYNNNNIGHLQHPPQNGNHSVNGSSNHWISSQQPRQQIPQQQYSGAPQLNQQMTSSTPDSGIQSIDGSPPSTSAFTPPMVSPYPIQTNHFDPNLTLTVAPQHQQLPSSTTQYSAGPMGSSMLRQQHSSRLNSIDGPQQSPHNIHLPPLNCMIQSSTSSGEHKNYLNHQHPTCSYQNGTSSSLICDTDDIRIDPIQSISPPALEGDDKPTKEIDSDCDYSDMPTLTRGDIVTKEPEKEVEEVRTASRISVNADEKKEIAGKSDSAIVAINPNMDANEIAKMLMSSLPSEKVQELLRSFRPAIEEENNVEKEAIITPPPPATAPSTFKVVLPSSKPLLSKDESEKVDEEEESIPKKVMAKQRKNSRKPVISPPPERNISSRLREKCFSPPPPPPSKCRGGKQAAKTRAVSKKPTLSATNNQKIPSTSKATSKNNSSATAAAVIVSKPKQSLKVVPKKPARRGSNAKTKKVEKTVITKLKRHPFSRNHRAIPPSSILQKYTLVEAAPSRPPPKLIPSPIGKPAFYGFGSSRLDRPIPKNFEQFLKGPSKLSISRYHGCSEKLAKLFESTHLNIPKVSMVKWEPSGAWKSAFEVRKRKMGKFVASEPPMKMSKMDRKSSLKKTDKFGPLKITIRRDSDASEIMSKKKKVSLITPVPKDIDFVKIRSNIIVETPPELATASKPCDCEDSDPCTSTSGCLSRTAFLECTQYSCQLYEKCQNHRLENNVSVHQLQIFKHPSMNHGVRSLTDISKDQLVCEFVGEVMRKSTYIRKVDSGQTYPHYGIELIPGSYVIDASKKGNLSRFMNHSCQPNCVMQRWIVRGKQRIGIFALKNIEAGVELTYNYSMHVYLKEEEECLCEATKCQGIIPAMPPPIKPPSKPERLTKCELEVIKKGKIFLQRNLQKYKTEREIPLISSNSTLPEISKSLAEIFNQFIHSCDKLPRRWLHHFSITMRKIFASEEADVVEFVEKFDTNMKCCLSLISKSMERRQADSLQHQYLQLKRHSSITEVLKDSHPNTLLSFLAERPRTRKNDHSPRILSATTDLSYMNSEFPIGSYDPDKESLLFSQQCSPDGDSIRCICGIMDEGGEMYQCDQCHYWLHRDCLALSKEPEEYICPFCEKNLKTTPLLDILLTPQPEYRIDSCIYYKTLVNCRGIQIRVNECVYVEKMINDEYKRRLKKFHDECVDGKTKSKKRKVSTASIKLPSTVEEPSESIFKPDAQKIFDRKDLRTFRIERLFKVPTGERFAFGCYYARPHETFVDPGRMFYKNELFWTPLFDTLPLDVIAGRCLCLEPQEFAAGRPKGPKYLEDDVFVCEYSIDKTQKVFEKIGLKNRYHTNTAEYLFDRYEKPLSMKRNFTPFLIKTDKKSNEKSSKNKIYSVAKQTGTLRLHQIADKLTSKP